MTTQLTKKYWLDVFRGWVEARDMPGPHNDEALSVIDELTRSVNDALLFKDGMEIAQLELAKLRAKVERYESAL